MEEQIRAFIDYLATQRGYKENTLLAYRNDLFQLRQFVAAERPQTSTWSRVDTMLLQAFILSLKARALSPSTLARKIAAIKSFYFYLFENQFITDNPAQKLDAPPVPKQLSVPLTEAQIEALLVAVAGTNPKGYRDRAMLEILYTTGLRVSELVSLPLDAVDLEKGVLRVGKRTLNLTPRAVDVLGVYLIQARPVMKAPKKDGMLFVNPRGQQLTRQGVWLILKHYAQVAGIETPITPHTLRHAFATHRLAEGKRIEEVQQQLGHAHRSTTLMYGRQQEHSKESQ